MESKDNQLSGFNLIQQSAIDGNLGTLSNLLKKRVDPDSCLQDGERAKDITALMLAVENNHLDCAQVLIDHGAQLENTAIIALLPVQEQDMGWTPLHFAAHTANQPAMEMLLQAGASPNPETSRLPLHVLVQSEAPESDVLKCIKVLIDAGADVNKMGRNVYHGTPLHSACANNVRAVVIRELHKYGARCDDDFYASLDVLNLHRFGDRYASVFCPSLLLIRGCEEHRHHQWEDAFIAFIDCYGVDYEIFFQLKLYCQSVQFHTTVLYAAVYHRQPELVQILLERGAKCHPSIDIVENNKASRDLNVDASSIALLSALFLNGNIHKSPKDTYRVLELLLQHGHDPNVLLHFNFKHDKREDDLSTLLKYCTYEQQPEMLELLIKHGAIPTKLNMYQTCTDCAISTSYSKDVGKGPECLEILLKGGLDPNLRNRHNDSGIVAALLDGPCAAIEDMGLRDVRRDFSEKGSSDQDEKGDESDSFSAIDSDEAFERKLLGPRMQRIIEDPCRTDRGCNSARCLKLLLKYGAYQAQEELEEVLDAMLFIKDKHPTFYKIGPVALCSITKSNALYTAGLIQKKHLKVVNFYMKDCGFEDISENTLEQMPSLFDMCRGFVMQHMKKRDEKALMSLGLPLSLQSSMHFRNTESGDEFEEMELVQYLSMFSKKKEDDEDDDDDDSEDEMNSDDERMMEKPMIRRRLDL